MRQKKANDLLEGGIEEGKGRKGEEKTGGEEEKKIHTGINLLI